jgi:hypothetical protein
MSRKSFALVVMALVSTGFVGTLALAQDDDEPRYWDVTGVGPNDVLIVHSAGSVQSSLVGLLAPDAVCLKNLGCRGGLTQKEYQTLNQAQREAVLRKRPRWCQVAFGNRRGWVARQFLAASAQGCVIDRRI